METADLGQPQVNAYVFEGKGDSNSFLTSSVKMVLDDTFHRLGGFVAAEALTGKADGGSSQVLAGQGSQQSSGLGDVAKAKVEMPLVDPTAYREAYRRNPTLHGVVNGIASYVAGQGWRLRPRNELFGNDQFSSPLPLDAEPNKGQLQVALAFLNGSEPEYSLSELLQRCETDVQSEGAGYIEVARDANGKPVRMYYAPGETMRILADYSGFVQIRGRNKAYWSRYGTGAKSVVVKKTSTDDGLGGFDVMFVGKTVNECAEQKVDIDELNEWAGKAEQGSAVATSVNEMMHFRLPSPRDTHYGEPPIISAIEDYLGDSNSKLFILTYFDRCTVPRMAVVIEGELTGKAVEALKNWAESQDKLEAMNSTLVLELPDGCKATFEKLSTEQLGDSGFLQYRDMCASGIRTAYRTPDSMVGATGNTNRAESSEANQQFITGVVRPRQLHYMSKINYLLREELGVTDWVFDLNVPDLISEKTKAEIANIYIAKGVWNQNEVRRTQGFAPVPGGDVNQMIVAGTGVVPIAKLEDFAYGGKQAVTAEGQKTPAKGTDIVMGDPATN